MPDLDSLGFFSIPDMYLVKYGRDRLQTLSGLFSGQTCAKSVVLGGLIFKIWRLATKQIHGQLAVDKDVKNITYEEARLT